MRFDAAEIQEVKDRLHLSVVFDRLGYKVKGTGRNGVTLCPLHKERTASCHVDDHKGRWHCYGCGESGDHIDILILKRGLTFEQAVSELGGVRGLTDAERIDIEKRQAKIKEEEAAERAQKRLWAARLWTRGKDIAGTHAASYLESRGLKVHPSWTFDLKFVNELGYSGFQNRDAQDRVPLGKFPAMIAAIRSGGELIGVHRTYLDPSEPKKLQPPGDKSRNKPKKVLGEQLGGVIWLSEPKSIVAVGEGIETTRSWPLVMATRNQDIYWDDYGLACGVSLGNLSGRSTGSLSHPSGSGRVPNGVPDMEHPAIVWPDIVDEIVLLGDGDSDPVMTSARLSCAGRRYREQGIDVLISMADKGKDWNDVLRGDNAKSNSNE